MDGRILVIDDQPANVALLEKTLKQAGYSMVESVTDPRQGVATFATFQPDLVLLDLNMPGMDGFTVLSQLRPLIPEGAFQPVLVITADTTVETKRRALDVGATDFLTKPLDLVEVRLRVKNLLETRSLHLDLARLNHELEDRVRERTRELEEAYAREKELTERLRELDRIKDDFLLAVSHEVRTPLAVILGAAQMLESDWQKLEPGEIHDLVSMVSVASQNLERLLDGVLDVDRLRRGLREPLRQPTDLVSLVGRVVERTNLSDHPLEVQVAVPQADVDPAQFERILENLLANAVQHTPAGTPIWLTVSLEEGGVLVAVDDAGSGIPDRLKDSVFELFVQGDTLPYTPGLGLGLSLVSRFARLHGGRAWVEDRAGGGSAFRAWLASTTSS